jgi:hypothetical protein
MERRWGVCKPPDVLRCPQMTGHGAKFGRQKEDAIVALLTHRTIEEAAHAVHVSTKTLLRWMKDPAFDTAYRVAKRAAVAQAIARLHHLSSAATCNGRRPHLSIGAIESAPASIGCVAM